MQHSSGLVSRSSCSRARGARYASSNDHAVITETKSRRLRRLAGALLLQASCRDLKVVHLEHPCPRSLAVIEMNSIQLLYS